MNAQAEHLVVERMRLRKEFLPHSFGGWGGGRSCQQILPLGQGYTLKFLEVQRIVARKGFPEKGHLSWVL